jgi:hypothetical protein
MKVRKDNKLGQILCLGMALMFTAGVAQGQQSLPILPQASGSTAGPTIAVSKYNPLPRVSQLPEDALRSSLGLWSGPVTTIRVQTLKNNQLS